MNVPGRPGRCQTQPCPLTCRASLAHASVWAASLGARTHGPSLMCRLRRRLPCRAWWLHSVCDTSFRDVGRDGRNIFVLAAVNSDQARSYSETVVTHHPANRLSASASQLLLPRVIEIDPLVTLLRDSTWIIY
jgi:hypothetical protein